MPTGLLVQEAGSKSLSLGVPIRPQASLIGRSLEPEPEEAAVVANIFELFVGQKMSPKAIANQLNQPGGPPSPRHVDSARNLRGHWAASSVRAMLKNPVYTGATVWNRLDFTEAKHAGGGSSPGEGGVGRGRGHAPSDRHD